MSGQLLRARRADNAKLWEWQYNGVQYNRASESIIITKDTEPLYQKLIGMGYPEENFYRPLKDLWLIPFHLPARHGSLTIRGTLKKSLSMATTSSFFFPI